MKCVEMCPCPRGGCEAVIKGTVIIVTAMKIDRKLTPEQRKWNKENHR